MPANAGDEGWIPGSERSLEEEMATCSSILTWKIHGQRSLVDYGPWGPKSWTRLNNWVCMHAEREREREDLGSTDEQEAKLHCSSLWWLTAQPTLGLQGKALQCLFLGMWADQHMPRGGNSEIGSWPLLRPGSGPGAQCASGSHKVQWINIWPLDMMNWIQILP